VKKTNRVRIRTDFVIELDREVDTLPIGGETHLDAMLEGAAAALKKAAPDAGLVAIVGPGRTRFSLDRRARKEPG